MSFILNFSVLVPESNLPSVDFMLQPFERQGLWLTVYFTHN